MGIFRFRIITVKSFIAPWNSAYVTRCNPVQISYWTKNAWWNCVQDAPICYCCWIEISFTLKIEIKWRRGMKNNMAQLGYKLHESKKKGQGIVKKSPFHEILNCTFILLLLLKTSTKPVTWNLKSRHFTCAPEHSSHLTISDLSPMTLITNYYNHLMRRNTRDITNFHIIRQMLWPC